MNSVPRVAPRGILLAVALAWCGGLLSASASAQGIGVPGIGMPGVGGSMGYMPQRQGPMAGTAGGVPGQMNPRMGGSGFRPGQVPGMGAPSYGQSRGTALIGTPRNASAFSGMAGGGMIQRSSDGVANMNRAVGVPGVGNVGRGNR
jgi:hypothetical protein